MKFGKYGVFTFTDIMNGAQLAELAGRVEALGYSTLWYPEAFNYETFALGGVEEVAADRRDQGGVAHVDHRAVVVLGELDGRVFLRGRGAADEQRRADAGALEFAGHV